MKYIDKMLIASGVTLLLTGGVAAAALTPSSADAVITQLPGDVAIFASNGPFGSPNILATAATYIKATQLMRLPPPCLAGSEATPRVKSGWRKSVGRERIEPPQPKAATYRRL